MTKPEQHNPKQLTPDQNQIILDSWRHILDQCEDPQRATMPIFLHQNGRLVQNRTGVLFQIGESHFLITAAHEMEAFAAARIPLYISPSRQGDAPIPLGGRLVGTEEKVIDVAVMELDQSIIDALLPARKFLGIIDTDLHRKPLQGLYLILGYPNDFTTVDMDAKQVKTIPLRYACYIYQGNPDIIKLYDPDKHLVLEHLREGHNTQGVPLTSPRIEGMSGCGIWRLTELKKGWDKNWTPENVKLVAIQNRCFFGKYCKGTWINYAVKLIGEKFPHLRPAIGLHLGKLL